MMQLCLVLAATQRFIKQVQCLLPQARTSRGLMITISESESEGDLIAPPTSTHGWTLTFPLQEDYHSCDLGLQHHHHHVL